jgi:hypothetical protein
MINKKLQSKLIGDMVAKMRKNRVTKGKKNKFTSSLAKGC